MEQCYLMPGQERCERFKDANGVPRVHYSYRSLHGAFFDCESRSLEEAQHLCEDWLVGQDRPAVFAAFFAKRQGVFLLYRLYCHTCAQTSSNTLPAMQRDLSEIRKQLESSSRRGSTSATLNPGVTG